MIYEYRDFFIANSTTTSSLGAGSSKSLLIIGGLLRQIVIKAGSSNNVFRSSLIDGKDFRRLNYDFRNGELNEITSVPLVGVVYVVVTDASISDDIFSIYLGIQE